MFIYLSSDLKMKMGKEKETIEDDESLDIDKLESLDLDSLEEEI